MKKMRMLITEMTDLDILRAIFTLVFVVISIIVGIKIILEYFKIGNPELITIGFAWIFVSFPWTPLVISFITIILFNYALDPVLYLFLMRAFLPIGLICWIYAFSALTYPKKKKKIFIPYLIICVVYEIILLYFLFTDYSIIATYEGGFTYRHSLFTTLFLAFVVLSILFTMILFVRKSLKSKDELIQWKGRFFVLAIIFFITGAFLEIFSAGNPVLQIAIRLMLIVSAIKYYFSFFLPDFLAKRLVKESPKNIETLF